MRGKPQITPIPQMIAVSEASSLCLPFPPDARRRQRLEPSITPQNISGLCGYLWLLSRMDLEVESQILCPYCGAVFTTVVDTSSGTFSTIEDCEICCRPIAVNVHCHYGEIESVEIDRA